MEIPRKDQIKFAKEILAIEAKTKNLELLLHLKGLVSLCSAWTNPNNDVIVYLDEYIYEVIAIARGDEDTGWKDEFKKKLDAELDIAFPSQTTLRLPRKEQVRFAKEVLAILDDDKIDLKTISHLKNLSTLLVSWTGRDNGVAIDLSEYVGELYAVKIDDGTGNVEWKDEYKERIEEDIADIE